MQQTRVQTGAPDQEADSDETAPSRLTRRLPPTWPFVAVALAALVLRRWWQVGAFPPGLDGGQWLALGRGLVGQGRSTEGAYAPLVPALVAAGRVVLGPIPALRLVAILSFALVLAAIYRVGRLGLPPWLALAVALLAGSASALAEPIAYGGYPQSVAFAGLLFGAGAFARALAGGGRGAWVEAAIALAAAAAAHHLYGPLALLMAAVIGLAWLPTRPRRTAVRRALFPAVLCLLPATATALLVAVAFLRAGYDPPVGAAGFALGDAWRYATREAPLLWSGVVLVGVAALAWRRSARASPLWQVAAALIVVPGLLVLRFPEVRLLPPLLCGGGLALGLGLRAIEERPGGRARLLPAAIVAALLVALLVALLPRADAQTAAYVAYYRVVDPSLLAAAQAVEASRPTGRVVVRASQLGWPVGWWFEGLTTAKIVAGSDRRWLGFPDERRAADLANRFFGRRLSGDQLRALAAETGVDLLVVRKWEWIGWQRWLDEPRPPVAVLFDDGEFLVLRIVPEASAQE